LRNRIKSVIVLAFLLFVQGILSSQSDPVSHKVLSDTLVNIKTAKEGIRIIQSKNTDPEEHMQKVTFRIGSEEEADEKIEHYLRNAYPIISDNAIEKIEASSVINKFSMNDSLGTYDTYVNFYVPKYYLDESPKILWELNIPAFESHIYQVYNQDTILIDTWRNVVGKPSTKTYTGHYEAFRLRNWPYWKDPELPDSVKPTPPGPNNPLGLFVVHYDENSLRYFHGTNKSYLLKRENRALSHGCVRNENGNIAKMKEFIINKIIKSDDLGYWLGSKQSMIYEIKPEDRFPVRIVYKTFKVSTDEFGDYIIFYKDIYNYEKHEVLSEYDDPSLITFATRDNIISEIISKHISEQFLNEALIPKLDDLIANHKDYQKYYFDDLISTGSEQ
jgi:hypothetical protein